MISSTQYGCYNTRNKGTCDCKLTISRKKLESTVLKALRTRLMDEELTKVFCEEYTTHINRQRIQHNTDRQAYEVELRRIDVEIEKVIQSIKDGIDVSLIKDHANGLQRRKEELQRSLSTTEEVPTYIHPRMADRYAAAVSDLVGSLNDPDHRDESAQILRKLIDRIVLTPNEDNSALVIDLIGDLAGILQISEKHNRKIELKPRDALDSRAHCELQQIEELAGSLEPLANCASQEGQGKLVAGVGFEPTTFRL